ncbi:MAG: calcium:proton antiporter [Pseudolabrys sp.]|nr:calcium:proton antiporter [Pseudolabrys sp.]
MTAKTATAHTKPSSVMDNILAELPLLAGAATTALFFTVGKSWTTDFSNLALTAAIFVWMFGVMIWCAFGVVRHAEVLAEYLGEPYGTLILTLVVISIEVTIMATVMLSGGPNPTLPRDTVFAVLMIVMNGMVGMSVIVGALRHRQQQYNLQGAVAFLAVITSLAVISLVLPTFTKSTPDSSMTQLQAVVFGTLTALLYGGFLIIQTMRHRTFFVEAKAAGDDAHAQIAHEGGDGHHHHGATYPVWVHAMLMIATLMPVVLLAKPLAKIIDFGLEELHAPTALGGILIAILVLSPEGLTSYQAASRNQLQRSVNLSLGSALSTIGLTIPTMLAISLFTGIPLELGLDPVEVVLLVLTLFIANMTFSGAPTNILLGGVHLVLFGAFVVLIFNP